MKNSTLKIFLIIAFISLLCGCFSTHETEVIQGAGYKNSKIQWGFKKIEGKCPEVPSQWSELLKKYDGFYTGDTASKKLYLTFDEGYENGMTARILDILKKENVTAAFFITGSYLKTQKELVLRMVNEGHIVGNHTRNHPSMPEVLSDKKLMEEISSLNDGFFSLTSLNMKYLRPPKGEFSERTLAISQKMGYKTILWSNAYVDWVKNGNTKQNAFNKVTKYLHGGCIILLHAVSEENTEALSEIISFAREKGYTFVSLDDL
ncbi:MAG: Peptidoglycan-N-acetylmuramic acid deacetylase PdaA precursor [Firmicutes bacterium ADurb.Bin193]|nr:MAG: Peptidoglycan-N-acetylmuramic acid deacetylase PdaA precursor [Firmicutes bacterium ADurb.Bin193]